jgi:hypothetical protein
MSKEKKTMINLITCGLFIVLLLLFSAELALRRSEKGSQKPTEDAAFRGFLRARFGMGVVLPKGEMAAWTELDSETLFHFELVDGIEVDGVSAVAWLERG